jgi:5-(carboxyamino)imidazole ribonucleotide synthase
LVSYFEELTSAIGKLWLPIILKTRWWGYDGKWQWKITEETNLKDIWTHITSALGNDNPLLIAEAMCNFKYEMSVIAAIDIHGGISLLGPMYNIHENGTIRYSIDPAPIPDEKTWEILEQAQEIADNAFFQGYVWLLTIEMFMWKDGHIWINEFAPRPHNSGHASLDSRDVDQNMLWMMSVSGRQAQETKVKNIIVMENILQPAELYRAMNDDILGTRLWKWRYAKFYNYQKLSGSPQEWQILPEPRKVWHINHGGNRIETLWNQVKEEKMPMSVFIRQISVLQ